MSILTLIIIGYLLGGGLGVFVTLISYAVLMFLEEPKVPRRDFPPRSTNALGGAGRSEEGRGA